MVLSALRCRSRIFTGSQPSVGHGPARLAQPLQLEREFLFHLLHSILNSLASGDRGARTSAVHTAANMPFLRAPRPDLNIYLSSLTVLSDETCTGCIQSVSVPRHNNMRHVCRSAGLSDTDCRHRLLAQGPMSVFNSSSLELSFYLLMTNHLMLVMILTNTYFSRF